jgi:hypothetical protein
MYLGSSNRSTGSIEAANMLDVKSSSVHRLEFYLWSGYARERRFIKFEFPVLDRLSKMRKGVNLKLCMGCFSVVLPLFWKIPNRDSTSPRPHQKLSNATSFKDHYYFPATPKLILRLEHTNTLCLIYTPFVFRDWITPPPCGDRRAQ